MKFLLGTKQKMTEIFDDNGQVSPATIVEAGPLTVTALLTPAKDKYSAVQFGYGAKRVKNISKAVRGQQKLVADAKTGFQYLRECRLERKETESDLKVGDTVTSAVFAPGDMVQVSAISKGRGFQGVVKRHGFHGGPRTHGQKHSEREPGSIGGGLRTRVPKGMRMAGRMGNDRVTVKNLKIIKVDAEKNQIFISGALPCRRGTLVEIRG